MTLDDLPRATSIFIDANIFIYHFTGASGECRLVGGSSGLLCLGGDRRGSAGVSLGGCQQGGHEQHGRQHA